MDFRKLNFPRLLVLIIGCQMAGVLGSIATYPNIPAWYATLQKPWFTPPNFVFGPVWLTLYTLMGVAIYLVLGNGWKKKETRIATCAFAIQLGLNTAWSFLFFGLRNPLLGLIDIIPMWFAIAATIALFYRINRLSGIVLLPYIAWVTLASLLNYFVWILN